MKIHTWMLLIISILFYSCSSVKLPVSSDSGTFTGEPIETSPQIPVAVEPEIPTVPTTPSPMPAEEPIVATELPSQGSQPIGPDYQLPNMRQVFTAKIENLNYSNYSGATDKLNKAEKLIVKIFNSKEYKEAILNFTFKGKKQFHDNNGLTNEQIYFKLYGGAEALMPAVNYQMDLKVKMYYAKFKKVVGYTYPSDLIVYTNWKYHQSYEPCRIASNYTHEWTHKMGFGHDSSYNSDRDYSVPYAHNEIIETLCEKAEKGLLTEL